MVGFSRNWENLTVIRTSHHLVRIQITFKTIWTPATEEFEQGDLNIKRTILHRTAQQVELITGTKEFRTFDNLRHFYCLQDHTTSNTMGKDKNKDGETTTAETPKTSAETVKHGTPP